MDESQLGEVTGIFGENIRRLREARGWSQSELARRMQAHGWPKYSQVAVSRTEEGSRAVRLDEALAFSEILEIGLTNLITPSDEGRLVDELYLAMGRVGGARKAVKESIQKLVESCNELELAVERTQGQAAQGWSQDQVAEITSKLIVLAEQELEAARRTHYRITENLEVGDGEHSEEA